MAAKTHIFFVGATGYIGGTVLTRLLAQPSAETLDITVLVRSQQKAKTLSSFGVTPIVGSYDDTALVEKLAGDAHVVIDCALSDQLEAVETILRGLRQRHVRLGDVPIYIHTSGTGVLMEGHMTGGMEASKEIYDDSDFDQVANISPTALHRDVDLAVFQADKEGYARTYVVLPSTVYGIAKTPLVDAGVQNPYSMQIPLLIKAALDRGRAGMVGKGLALKPNVHIDEVADLYMILYDAIVRDGPDNIDHGIRGYYYGENGEHSWYDISKAIGRAMVELGLSKDDEPTAFSTAELVKYFGSELSGIYFGANSRARGTHSRSLGWKPKFTTDDMLASIKPEMEAILKSQQH